MDTDDFKRHHRQSIRLRGYDYTQNSAYFLTFCVQQRECLFGEINDQGNMKLNDAGQMIEKWWKKLSDKFPEVEIDEYIIMPNHFHGILVIVGADPRVCPNEKEKGAHVGAPLQKPAVGDMVQDGKGAHVGAPLQKPAVGNIVQWFKTMTTNEYIRGVKERNWEPFPGKLWQRNYYEHVIRNKSSLNDIRAYIQTNPARWAEDQENPANIGR